MRLVATLTGVLVALAGCSTPPRDGPVVVEPQPVSDVQQIDRQDELIADITAICELVPRSYIYFDEVRGWESACAEARDSVEGQGMLPPAERLAVLDELLAALEDEHVSLNVNSASSFRLVPSGSDVRIERVDGYWRIVAVRQGSGAAKALFEPTGRDYLIEINGTPIEEIEQTAFGLNRAAAGRRDEPRSLSIIDPLMARTADTDPVMVIEIGNPEPEVADTLVSAQIIEGFGYIRFNDSLDEPNTVQAFDAALESLRSARGWIIDLRETPGGGNTGVAEPILGRFVSRPAPYQVTVYPDRAPEPRYVHPRGPWLAEGPVVVIVGRWTGSMGEGMAVGFDGLGVATVIGSEMAGLRGGVEEFPLPSGLRLRLPTYDLTHVDGTPRDKWRPPVGVIADNGAGRDVALELAMDILRDAME